MARRATTGLRALLLLCLLALATALWGKKDAAPADAAGGKKKAKDVTKLQIGVKRKVEDCARRAADGDRVYVHYRGTLTDGTQFDASCASAPPRAPRRSRRAHAWQRNARVSRRRSGRGARVTNEALNAPAAASPLSPAQTTATSPLTLCWGRGR